MASCPRVRQHTWSNHLALRPQVRKHGSCNLWKASIACIKQVAVGTRLSTRLSLSLASNTSLVSGAATFAILPLAQLCLWSMLMTFSQYPTLWEKTLWFYDQLKSKWDISDLGPIKFALSIAVKHNTDTISLSQTAFIDCILKQFSQIDAHPVDTPMVAGLQLCYPDKSIPTPPEVTKWREQMLYCELVGSLNYIIIATCPDIAYAVGQLASFLDCFLQDHWTTAIHILHYLKGTKTLLLVLGGTCAPSLLGYSDADFANCKDTSQSISGYC